MMPLLTTKGLSRRFGGLRAVDGVDFALMPGEIRAIIGPNGAGKTTFVSLLSGRIQPSSGMIVFDGADITTMPAYKRVRLGVAYTFQITSVFANLTAYDNVALPVQRTLTDGRSKGQVRSGVMAALERTGLALRPRLLILDEPTQGLADSEIDNFVLLVREIAKHATVLLIEHNMPVVMQLADRITVFNSGKILAEGTPEQIRANAEVQDAYLGATHG
ncbi:ABC transporter ATP-binding protein [Mesorhizobium sp.]|uniref:ABC transporter ATP-binding protein n=1 Tax=Mesorhizobium sp. TaxID=1871066 RepID=UPI00120A8465|nr:ABC transporter ATP-binding protein [Mesorhizobium sp.]TIS21388.1 MAG: ABC transporter ATP-binding protein [Mesorhizobium sp.]